MFTLPEKSSAEEVRAIAGLTKLEWQRFIDITQDAARSLRETTPDIRWRRVSARQKEETREKVNDKLREEGVSPIDEKVLWWRMSRVLANLKHSEARTALKLASLPAVSEQGDAIKTAVSDEGTHAATLERDTSRYFDPVRDV